MEEGGWSLHHGGGRREVLPWEEGGLPWEEFFPEAPGRSLWAGGGPIKSNQTWNQLSKGETLLWGGEQRAVHACSAQQVHACSRCTLAACSRCNLHRAGCSRCTLAACRPQQVQLQQVQAAACSRCNAPVTGCMLAAGASLALPGTSCLPGSLLACLEQTF